MRLFLGMILGCLITVGGAYVADSMNSGTNARPLVNWDVVGKAVDGLSGMARDGFKRITG
jgi:hypothetical protein